METSNKELALMQMRNLTDCIAAMLHSMACIQSNLLKSAYTPSNLDIEGVGELLRRMNACKADLMDWEQILDQWSRIADKNKLNQNKD